MSNLNLNKVILCGRLTADPELKMTTSASIPVVSFTLAVNRRTKNSENQTDFINCVAWRATAEFISKYFHKGSAMCIVGSLQVRKWNDPQTNQSRSTVEVIVDEAMFVDSKGESSAPTSYATGETYAAPAAAESFDVVKNEDDLPF